MKCDECRYWHETEIFIEGECRQFSPDTGSLCEQRWPRTRPDEWCGQFQLRVVEPIQIESFWQRLRRKVKP